jgi:uncharacterized protein (DUF488 family)
MIAKINDFSPATTTTLIWTIGYQGRTISDFIHTLQKHQIDVLVDVRILPFSRKRGFSKTPLTTHLETHHISYLHCRELGNPKENRSNDVVECLRRFEEYMVPRWTAALACPLALARSKRICLMCMEANPAECHRTSVANALAQRLDGCKIVAL